MPPFILNTPVESCFFWGSKKICSPWSLKGYPPVLKHGWEMSEQNCHLFMGKWDDLIVFSLPRLMTLESR